MIDTKNWKPFRLSELFEITKGISVKISDQAEGDTPFISASRYNNGIKGHFHIAPMCEGNAITLSCNGSVGEAFYQAEPFSTSSDVNVLKLKNRKLTEPVALFFCTILRFESWRWTYARKWGKLQMENTVIKLPATNDGKVDYDFMERFIKSLDDDVSDLIDDFFDDGYDKACDYMESYNLEDFENNYKPKYNDAKPPILRNKLQKMFALKDIFPDIHNGKSYDASDLAVPAPGGNYIAYITRTNKNNGIAKYVAKEDYKGLEEPNAITIGDTTATVFYHDYPFITGKDIIILRADWLNAYTANYVLALLEFEKGRYPVMGRAFTKTLIKETRIPLPVKGDGTPDFAFMEEFIKAQRFSAAIRKKYYKV